MSPSERVLVYGATGHTGRFVVDELLRRGLEPVLAGRDAGRLAAGPERHAGLERRATTLHDPVGLRRALVGAAAVVNCAGPFLDTALPLAGAAVDAGAHYLDVTAEQPVVQALYRVLDAAALSAGVSVVPAMAFYGGLADLLVTAVLQGGTRAETVDVAIGLDRWWPTAGTRATGERNTAPRLVIRDGVLVPLESPAPVGTWAFDEPLGEQAMVELPFSEVITINRHLAVGDLRSHLNTGSLEELRDAATPAPAAVDEQGRSAQRFVVDVVAGAAGEARRVSASGRDIYAVSAPIVVEGVTRLLDGRHRGAGALAPGQAFDAADVLAGLQGSGAVTVRAEQEPFAAGSSR